MTRRIYLDYCATTPVHPEVREAMRPALDQAFGNPSSLHWMGRAAREQLDAARGQVAAGIGAHPGEIYFTSGATEADNLALIGSLRGAGSGRRHLITSSVEHHAILHAAQTLERDGCSVTYLPVDSRGRVSPDEVRAAIRPDTGLISVMMVNNEVGTVQPIAEIGAIAREHGVSFHTDAVQGVGLLDVEVDELGVDLLSLSAHKLYGPKGVGALYVRQGVRLEALVFGGPQEGGLRPGTENVPGIVGLGAAVGLAVQHRAGERERLGGLRQFLVEGLARVLPECSVNVPASHCAPHVISASFPGADAEMMLFRLSEMGIAVSMGSACNSESIEPSHVLLAMGLPREAIEGTLRVSLGYPTTAGDLDALLSALPEVVQACRSA